MKNNNLIKHEILKHLNIISKKEDRFKRCLSVKELSLKIKCSYDKAKLNCIELQKKRYITYSLRNDNKERYMYSDYDADVVFYANKYKNKYWKNIKENLKTCFNISATLISVITAFISVSLNYSNSESNNELKNKIELIQKEQKEALKEIEELQKKVKQFSETPKNQQLLNSRLNQ